jgi:hypothetical protein
VVDAEEAIALDEFNKLEKRLNDGQKKDSTMAQYMSV